jgi:hypothetical protein
MHFLLANLVKVRFSMSMHLELEILGQTIGRRSSQILLPMIVALISAPLVRDEEPVESSNKKYGTRSSSSSCIVTSCSRAIRARHCVFVDVLTSRFVVNVEVA